MGGGSARWVAICVLLLAATVAAGAARADAAPAAPGLPTVLLHLSDMHFSTNVAKYWRLFGDREGDMGLFAAAVAPALAPRAVLVTGDLTDAKTAPGAGLQQEAEWAAYRAMLRNLTAASGGGGGAGAWSLPESVVLDVRGNHDCFNVAERGGPADYWTRSTAEGRRSGPRARVFLHAAFPPGAARPTQVLRADGVAAAGACSSSRHGDGGFVGVAGDRSSGAAGGALGDCPAAWLLGVDASPAPGLKSPTNFVGLVRPALLAEVEARLLDVAARHPARCGPPVVVAYGHYPLSTLEQPPARWTPAVLLHHALRNPASMQGLAVVLAAHNVTAYINGHLHSAFGHRLHRLHPTQAGGHLAELETSAWKDDRRFRLLAVDSPRAIGGGAGLRAGELQRPAVLSFMDLHFHGPGSPVQEGRPDAQATASPDWLARRAVRGWGVTATDPSASVLDYAVLITSPADARYGPLAPALPAQLHEAAVEEGSCVRALLFPLDAAAAQAAAAAPSGAGGGFHVSLAVSLPDNRPVAAAPMTLAPGQDQQVAAAAGGGLGPLLFRASATILANSSGGSTLCPTVPAGVGGTHTAYLQVTVAGAADGSISTSMHQPATVRCAPLPPAAELPSRCECVVVAAQPGDAPLPLDVSWLEWLTLAVSWPIVVHRMFLAAWGLHLGGLLLLPRVLHGRWARAVASSPLFQPGAASAARSSSSSSSSLLAAVHAAGRATASWLAWPVAALVLVPGEPAVWHSLVGFSLYLVLGPWLVANSLDSYPVPRARHSLFFHYGVLGRFQDPDLPETLPGGWQFVGTPDTFFISLLYLLACILPLTLWVACVVGARQQRRLRAAVPGVEGPEGPPPLFTAPQRLALGALVTFNCAATYWKVVVLSGPMALLLSPAVGWAIPAAVLLVAATAGGSRRGDA